MERPPVIQTTLEALPSDQSARHEFLTDAFGRYLLWAMAEALARSKTLVGSQEARSKLGRIFQGPYSEAATKLTPEQLEIAFTLAEKTLETFARNTLTVLGAQGITFRLGEDHAVQFRLTAEIRDIENMEIKLEEVINRNGKRAFTSNWGHWLAQSFQARKQGKGVTE